MPDPNLGWDMNQEFSSEPMPPATPDRAANVLADCLMDFDLGLPGNEAYERARDMLFELESQGFKVVPADWAKEASANDNA